MVLELILGISLFHHKHKPKPPAPTLTAEQREFIDKALDTVVDAVQLINQIKKQSPNTQFEDDEIKAAESAAVKAHEEDKFENLSNDVTDLTEKVGILVSTDLELRNSHII